MERLLNKVAVVTGANSGIGLSIASHFLAEGAKVVGFSRSTENLNELAAQYPDRLVVEVGDVTKSADLQRLADTAVARFGAIDVVIPNAGIGQVVPFADSTEDVINHQFSVNFMGTAQTVRACLPHMNEGSAIIFITTFLTQVGFPGLSVYNASKGAVKSLAQTLAAELAPQKIRVNSLAPGPTNTPLWTRVGLSPEQLGAMAEQVTARLMTDQFGDCADIANTAVFLASDEAKNIYGQEIVVDGGYTIG